MNPLIPVPNAILLVGALAVVAGFLAWRSSASRPPALRHTLVALRVVGITLLLVPFLNPGHWEIPPAENDSEWAVLLDRSASMTTADVDQTSRLTAATTLAETARATAEKLGKSATIYSFGDQSVQPFDLTAGPADPGTLTDIAGAVASLVSRYSAGSPALEGVILLSDGHHLAETPMEKAILPARSTEAPVFAIALGGPIVNPDLAVETSRRQYTVFSGQEISINATLHAKNTPPRSAEIRLVENTGTVAEKHTVRLGSEESATAAFSLKDLATGYHEFWIETDAMDGEKDILNNRTRFGVQVLDETIRVLLVEGNPYWDTKFIAKLLQRERNYAFELVYRLSSERFFSLASATDAPELAMAQRAAFPATAAELADYDLIVLGRSVEGFLDSDKATLLTTWVKNGGALVLARGNPVTTPLPALDPLFPMEWDAPFNGAFHWRPTTSSEEAGLFGADLPGRLDPIWNKLPPLHEAVTGSQLKPFTQVLVEGVALQGQRESRFPLIVSRRYGEGRVVSVNCDDLWRWDFFPRFPEAADIYRDFWLQLFNWIVSYSDFLPGRQFALKVSHQAVEVGTPIRARVMQRPDSTFEATPKLVLTREGQEVSTIEPTTSPANPHQWDAVFPFTEPGLYSIRLETGDTTAPLHATVAVLIPPGETDDLSANPAYLKQLAEKTGGRLVSPDEMETIFADRRPPPWAGDGTAEWKSSWDTWIWLLPMLGFFAAEWILRRRNGLI